MEKAIHFLSNERDRHLMTILLRDYDQLPIDVEEDVEMVERLMADLIRTITDTYQVSQSNARFIHFSRALAEWGLAMVSAMMSLSGRHKRKMARTTTFVNKSRYQAEYHARLSVLTRKALRDFKKLLRGITKISAKEQRHLDGKFTKIDQFLNLRHTTYKKNGRWLSILKGLSTTRDLKLTPLLRLRLTKTNVNYYHVYGQQLFDLRHFTRS